MSGGTFLASTGLFWSSGCRIIVPSPHCQGSVGARDTEGTPLQSAVVTEGDNSLSPEDVPPLRVPGIARCPAERKEGRGREEGEEEAGRVGCSARGDGGKKGAD